MTTFEEYMEWPKVDIIHEIFVYKQSLAIADEVSESLQEEAYNKYEALLEKEGEK